MSARRRHRYGRLLSFIFLLGGAVLLFEGGRELWEARQGQSGAAQEWERPVPIPVPAPNRDATVPRQNLRLGETVAKLSIPRLGAQLYVVEGVDRADLRRGPGHMPGSALPGTDGNCVVAGHRDTHFRVLKDIRKGDEIVLATRSGSFVYRVRSTAVVSPRDTASIQPSHDAVLHLITCYPFYYVGRAPKRFIVEADRASVESASLPSPHS